MCGQFGECGLDRGAAVNHIVCFPLFVFACGFLHSFQPVFGVERNMANSSHRKAQTLVDDRNRVCRSWAVWSVRPADIAPLREPLMGTATCLFPHACCHFKRLRVCASMQLRNLKNSLHAKTLLRCVQAMYPFCRCPSCTLESSVHDCGSRGYNETTRHRNERLDTHAVAEVKFGNNYQTML